MKRILAITLSIIMLLVALTGCMASQNPLGKEGEQNPSGSEGEQNPSGSPLTITLTIAETLPSCVAFEYKDEKPYCFYAYDTEGKLYRVFWNDFTGLNEKDVIVVNYSDDIKTLTYDEYLDSGWTPQYEVTAIEIKQNPSGSDGEENQSDIQAMITYSAGDVLSQTVLNNSEKQIILNILDSDKEWIADIPECDWICRFSGAVNVGYCDCGTLSDLTNNRSRKLTAEEKERIEDLISRYNENTSKDNSPHS